MSESIVMMSEPLLRPEFTQTHFIGGLAGQLSRWFDVAVAAPSIGPAVQHEFQSLGVEPISAGVSFPEPRSGHDEVPSFVESWMRDALLGTNQRWTSRLLGTRPGLRINLSMTNASPCDVRFFQSQPLAESVRAILPNFPQELRTIGTPGLPLLDWLDRRQVRRSLAGSRNVYATTRFVAERYLRRGADVRGLISGGFVLPEAFVPTTTNPTRDYALVYLGKETDMAVVRELIRLGIDVRLFGGKSASLVEGALGGAVGANAHRLGRVSHEELRDLYSNALFTAFPFTDESFGLVPVESMACGTPVLTYARQGPGETVIDGVTGWLADGPRQFVQAAHRLFLRGYPSGMRECCLDRARYFWLPNVAQRWRDVLTGHLNGSPPMRRALAPDPVAPSLANKFLSISDLVAAA